MAHGEAVFLRTKNRRWIPLNREILVSIEISGCREQVTLTMTNLQNTYRPMRWLVPVGE